MSGEETTPFLDTVSRYSTEVRRYSGEIAQYVDTNFDKVADLLRDQLANATWIPEPVKSRLPGPRPTEVVETVITTDLSFYDRVQDWLYRNRVLATFVALCLGSLSYRAVSRAISARKFRRARRAASGARCEVVIIAASPQLPVTQSLAFDLERRGFMIFVVCGTAEEERAIKHMSRPDIRALSIDITDTANAAAALDRFTAYLNSPQASVPGARRNQLTLTGVILIPSLSYKTSPIATIPPSNFADLFNTHLLHPILSIQAFLPLLTARTALQPGEKSQNALLTAATTSFAKLSSATKKSSSTPPATAPSAPAEKTPPPPKVLVFTPSIISSVNPPFHAPESTVCSALTAFTEVLAAELRPLNIPVTHIQLGTFDWSGFAPSRSVMAHRTRVPPPPVTETLAWSEPVRHVYGRNFTALSTSALGSGRAIRGLRGTAMRDLHHAVFDVLDGSNTNSVVRVGLGADLYGFVGRFMPRGLVAWMMGVRKVEGLDSLYKRKTAAAPPPESATSSAVSANGSEVSDTSTVPPAPPPTISTIGKPTKRAVVPVGEDVLDSHIWQQ